MKILDTVEFLKAKGLLKIIDEELDVELEIPHVAYVEVKQDNSKALLFTKPINKRLNRAYNYPVLMNIFGSFKALFEIFAKDPDQIAQEIRQFLHLKPPNNFAQSVDFFTKLYKLKHVKPKRLKTKGKSQEIILPNDLRSLPILKTWSHDGGPFITMGQVYTQSLNGEEQNVGMYRLQVYDKNHLGMHWQIHKDGAHFFHEYKKAGKKMPVSIAIGGDPLYIWCAQAPMPKGMFELLLYGFVRGENARLVKSMTNDIFVPEDADFIIEGFVDTQKFLIEGPFGDHTGYYTPKEPYPVLELSAISSKKDPVFHATVVGKPPLEDKYFGYATERIFLPLLQSTTPDLIDYKMPENGVFHNLILAKIDPKYPSHAEQIMHAFWGVGQLSFVKHAIFVDKNAPDLGEYEALCEYVLNRLDTQKILITHGICDALDHASPNACCGGKLGVDATGELIENKMQILSNEELLSLLHEKIQIKNVEQYFTHTSSPICVISVEKTTCMKDYFKTLQILKRHVRVFVIVDEVDNNVKNPYMLIWRVANNIDALRDVLISEDFIFIDATAKNHLDNYARDWPEDVKCDMNIIKKLNEKNIISTSKEFLHYYDI